ncbi:hypothetical protein ACFX2B_009794 [Malus domestica]
MRACRSNIGGFDWKRQVYLLRTCHALHSPLGSCLPGYYQKWYRECNECVEGWEECVYR